MAAAEATAGSTHEGERSGETRSYPQRQQRHEISGEA